MPPTIILILVLIAIVGALYYMYIFINFIYLLCIKDVVNNSIQFLIDKMNQYQTRIKLKKIYRDCFEERIKKDFGWDKDCSK